MGRTQWIILFSIFVVSCVSLALFIVSIATPNWLSANARAKNATIAVGDSDVKYGLFTGTLVRRVLSTPQRYDLTLTCDYSQSACMYSCQKSADDRLDELHRIMNHQQLQPCPLLLRSLDTSGIPRADGATATPQFINPGLWLSTVIFLSVAIVFTFVSGAFAIVNMVYNPIEPIFSITGLYVWNGISSIAALLVLVLWGALFGESLSENIAITDTLASGYDSDGLARLGYSYYLVLVSLLLNLANIGLLVLGAYLVDKEAEPPAINFDANDSPLEFY